MQPPRKTALSRLLRFAPWLAIGAGSLILSATPDAVARFGWHADADPAQLWRWLSAHLVHLGPGHLAINMLALAVLAQTALRFEKGGAALGVLAASALGVCAGIDGLAPQIRWYVGLSGALHGVFAWLCLTLFVTAEGRALRALSAALWLGGVGKLAIEYGMPIGTPGWLGVPSVPPAHLYGYACGTLFWGMERVYAAVRRAT